MPPFSNRVLGYEHMCDKAQRPRAAPRLFVIRHNSQSNIYLPKTAFAIVNRLEEMRQGELGALLLPGTEQNEKKSIVLRIRI